jgi:SpoVK/Ycf46/Vps4 family AAA+-type ATPase
MTEGHSGSDLYDIVQAVHLKAVREVFKDGDPENREVDLRSITVKDFYEEIRRRRPSVSKESLILYDRWFERFKAL